ncbi:serine hydrolase-domain-containing protein [Clohesyomyces aquaticus]|uniref:Serine hydrolase-domain-containing protein n=1 Tax=Clohesyomyces aquaticus TaxID=1231657 RepID=A0A1Y1ZTP9_9PLEO|nr:serine hydrolase-domain-containing protein [Clohesyomyces aquaticus]
MLRNVKTPKPRKPIMLMLHGSGSSAAIFGVQTHLLAKSLSKTYDLIYLDAPIPSAPGPGVLPLFADMPSYSRWLAPSLPSSLRVAELFGVAQYIAQQLQLQNIDANDVVSILGFSQGAMTALSMLALRLLGLATFPSLRFVVAIGAGTTGDVAQMDGIEKMMGKLSEYLERSDGRFPGYTVQACGLRDLWYKDGKRLQGMCAREMTKTMDYRDGHVVPRTKVNVNKLVGLIADVEEASKCSLQNTVGEAKDLMGRLFSGRGGGSDSEESEGSEDGGSDSEEGAEEVMERLAVLLAEKAEMRT